MYKVPDRYRLYDGNPSKCPRWFESTMTREYPLIHAVGQRFGIEAQTNLAAWLEGRTNRFVEESGLELLPIIEKWALQLGLVLPSVGRQQEAA